MASSEGTTVVTSILTWLTLFLGYSTRELCASGLIRRDLSCDVTADMAGIVPGVQH
jgi:hypothetical protein